uniref:RUN domain-containing protein n=1 Tax=Laticauda laticaudata TaxID=8630 RepID=A0A8C5SQP8_LATLA
GGCSSYHGRNLTSVSSFVKDVRWLSPHAACHVDKFIHLHENGQQNPERTRERTLAELWLQHSLQFHCLSAQLKPLLENKEYIRKFYTDSAFLLSDAHVTVMLQCLEAVEQNNHRLLPQIDESLVRNFLSFLIFGSVFLSFFLSFFLSSFLHLFLPFSFSRRCSQPPAGPPPPHLRIFGPNDEDNVLASGTSSRPLPNPNSDSWSGSQDETDGPEYLAIGNLGRASRPCDSPEESGTATLNSSGSSTSNLFSSSSSQKQESGSSWGELGGSWKSSLLRRSSFSEGQASIPQGKPKRSHMRSHSDTNVASAKAHGKRGKPGFTEKSALGSFFTLNDCGSLPHSPMIKIKMLGN